MEEQLKRLISYYFITIVKVREQVLKVFERGHRVILSRSQNSNGQREAISPAAHLVHRQEESTLSASKQEEDAHSGFQDVTPHAQFISVLSSFKVHNKYLYVHYKGV